MACSICGSDGGLLALDWAVGDAEHLGFGKSGAARVGRCNADPDPDLARLADLARLTIVGLASAGEGAKLALASGNCAASAAGA